MATEKWIAGSGAGLTWAGANTSATLYNGLVAGSSLMSDLDIANGTALDIFCDISWVAGGTATTASPANLSFYIYPLNEDGTTYGDGRFATAGAAIPPAVYYVGTMGFVAAAGTTITGTVTGIIMPPGSFKFVVYNGSGAALANTNVFKYRTYNRSVA